MRNIAWGVRARYDLRHRIAQCVNTNLYSIGLLKAAHNSRVHSSEENGLIDSQSNAD